MPIPKTPQLPLTLRIRVAAVTTISGATYSLIEGNVPAAHAAMIVFVTTVGAIVIGRRVTAPYTSPFVRITVLAMILVTVNKFVRFGYPAAGAIAGVLLGVWCATELARWLSGSPRPQVRRIGPVTG